MLLDFSSALDFTDHSPLPPKLQWSTFFSLGRSLGTELSLRSEYLSADSLISEIVPVESVVSGRRN